jgi:hypothetical protein
MQVPKVWLVYQEFQADTPDIIGLFQSRGDAELAAEECRRSAREEYEWVVYGDQTQGGAEIAEWDVDVHVEQHEVLQARHQPRRTNRVRQHCSEVRPPLRNRLTISMPRRPRTLRTSRRVVDGRAAK